MNAVIARIFGLSGGAAVFCCAWLAPQKQVATAKSAIEMKCRSRDPERDCIKGLPLGHDISCPYSLQDSVKLTRVGFEADCWAASSTAVSRLVRNRPTRNGCGVRCRCSGGTRRIFHFCPTHWVAARQLGKHFSGFGFWHIQ